MGPYSFSQKQIGLTPSQNQNLTWPPLCQAIVILQVFVNSVETAEYILRLTDEQILLQDYSIDKPQQCQVKHCWKTWIGIGF